LIGEVHRLPHRFLLIDIVKLLSNTPKFFNATSKLNVSFKGFTGRILKIANKIEGVHRFTGQNHQMGVPTLICLCLFVVVGFACSDSTLAAA
jgi:hypothetical protein